MAVKAPNLSQRKSVSVPNSASQATQNLSILFADDTPAYQKFVRQILESRGHVVTLASDGRQAMQLCEQHSFDVIVVDVQMPVVNGLELATWVRSCEKSGQSRTPIVALTAHLEASNHQPGAFTGIDAYLTKPIDAENFIRVVEQLAISPKGQPMKVSTSQGTTKPAAADDLNASVEAGPIVDFQGAMIRLGGDRDLFKEFIAVYDEDMPVLVEALTQAVRGHDGNGVERNAHSLRGLISNFGARRAVEAASLMEEIGKKGRWAEAPSAWENLEHEIQSLSQALDEYR